MRRDSNELNYDLTRQMIFDNVYKIYVAAQLVENCINRPEDASQHLGVFLVDVNRGPYPAYRAIQSCHWFLDSIPESFPETTDEILRKQLEAATTSANDQVKPEADIIAQSPSYKYGLTVSFFFAYPPITYLILNMP